MKMKLFIAFVVLSMTLMHSCKKQEIETTPLASLQIIDAVVGGETLTFGTNVTKVAVNSATAFGVLTGNRQVKLEASRVVYYNQAHDFANGGVYSLFLAGTPTSVEPVFLKEEHIVQHINNVFGVRVINLSKGSRGIMVNLEGSVAGSLFSSADYKSLTEFKEVSAEGSQVFEFRDAVSGELIQSFQVPDYDIARFRNITLVFAGSAGAELVFRINNY